MTLTCGLIPGHSTIAAFVSSLQEEIVSLFRDVLLVCEEQGVLGGTHFACDGLKLSAHAAKEWSGTFDDLRRKKEELTDQNIRYQRNLRMFSLAVVVLAAPTNRVRDLMPLMPAVRPALETIQPGVLLDVGA